MHLFLVVLGGRSRGCNIEQHDVRFVAGHRVEDALPQLRRQWFGLQRGLHLDSWLQVRQVEGWRVELRREPSTDPQRLWFVNVGAYDPECPWELHAFGLFVAASAGAATAKARRRLLVGASQQHKDDSCALETLSAAGPGDGAAAPAAGEPAAKGSRPGASPQSPPGLGEEAARPEGAGAGGSASPGSDSRRLARSGAEPDDVLALQTLGRWHVHLLPPQAGADTGWQPLRPDWFGYRRIDQPEPD